MGERDVTRVEKTGRLGRLASKVSDVRRPLFAVIFRVIFFYIPPKLCFHIWNVNNDC